MNDFAAVIPVESIDAQWLTKVFSKAGYLKDGEVTSVTKEPCGTGQLGDSFRFNLTYSVPLAGPSTIVGKFPSVDKTSREFGRDSGYYSNEIKFYNELEPHLSVEVAKVIHGAIADNQTDFILLMEDLAPARGVDQLKGCTADEAALVMEQAAAFHAGSWGNPEWLNISEWQKGVLTIYDNVTDSFGEIIKNFPEIAGDLVPEADLAEASKLIPYADVWKRVFNDPQCLWHSDLRADNVLFDAQDGKRPVVVLDWQGLAFGRGTMDIALYIGTSMTTEDRRAHERDLVTHYHNAMKAYGVTDYDAEQCWNDYRMHSIYGLQVGTFGFGAVKRTARGDEMWKSWIERTAAQVRDLDGYSVLKAF
ncbi:MAG: oxidoreductase family protein [Porticoccaceae bacterium]|nr:DUF1679 domain-containing protein [Pseudomonadales bacterium]MCP5171221.1 DUF1679 domain-containing protein [Pseudomonadales bacterium]MCP5301540.1 DUF1679 domain-containing protein [Pseudomonadales bacterium]